MKRILSTSIFAAIAAVSLAESANAAPSIGIAKSAFDYASSGTSAEVVTYRKRGWRGSQWNNGRRHAYRGRGLNRYYGRRSYGYRNRPGLYLNFGDSRGYSYYGDDSRRWR